MKHRNAILYILFSVMLPLKAQTDNNLFDAYGNFYSGNYDKAISAFDNLIQESYVPRSVDFLYRGICYYKSGNYQEALPDFVFASEHKQPEAYLWRARTYVVFNNFDEAVNCLKKYLQEAPVLEIEDVKKDTVFKKLYTSEAWYEFLENYRLSAAQDIINEAEYFAGRQKYNEAHNLIESYSGNQDIRLIFYNSRLFAAEGNTELAINELNRGLAAYPDHVILLRQKAGYLMQLKNYSEAYGILTKIQNSIPEDFNLRYSRAEAAYYSGNLTDAKNDMDLYLKYFNNEEAIFLAGEIEYASGRYLSGLRYFNKLLENNASSAAYFKARGMTYYQTNTLQPAAYDLSMSLDLVPDDAEANYYLGLTQNLLGNKKMACYYLKRAKKYGDLRAVEYIQKNCNK